MQASGLATAALGALSALTDSFLAGGNEDSSAETPPTYVNVMGVTACGKTTLSKALAKVLGVPYVEADPLHLDESKERSRRGKPLDDRAHRWPWLVDRAAPAAIEAATQSPSGLVVLDPSVLSPKLRRWLRDALNGPVVHINPYVTYDVALDRAIQRAEEDPSHIISGNTLKEKASQIHNQFAVFRPLGRREVGKELDGTLPTETLLVKSLVFLFEWSTGTGNTQK